MAYLVDATHPLLSRAGARLTIQKRAAEQRVAETALGLSGTDFQDDKRVKVHDALAMQISLQVARNAREYLAQSTTQGERSITFKEGVALHPLAVLIAEELTGGAEIEPEGRSFRVITTLR